MNPRLGPTYNRKSGSAPHFFDLHQLPPHASREFSAIQSMATYSAGTPLFLEKRQAKGVFLLHSGLVKLFVTSKGGKALILRLVQPGEALGLTESLHGLQYESSAETLQRSTVTFIRRDDFLHFVQCHPEVYPFVVNQLVYEYTSATEQLREIILSQSATEKLARLLLRWAAGGRETREGIQITVPLTHEQIAECVGSSRETITRTFSELKNKHVIRVRGATIVIENRAALESISRP